MTIKKILIIAIAVTLVGLGVWLTWWLLNTGTLEVNSSDDATISLIEVGDEELISDVIGSGSERKRLRPGTYTVAVENEAGGAARKTVAIEARETTVVDLDPSQILQPEEILSGASYSIVASGDNYRFLDPNLELIYELRNGSHRPTPLYNQLYPVKGLRWIDFANAVVEHGDSRYSLIRNGNVRDFVYPEGLEPPMDGFWSGINSYDFNGQGQMVLSMENQLFYYPSVTSQPLKIFDLDEGNVSVSLSNDGQIFIHTDAFSFGHGEHEGYNLLMDVSGNVRETSEAITDGGITFAEWSPGGDKLLVEIDGDTYIYDVTSQDQEILVQNPPENIEATTWLNNTEAVMVIDGALWRVDIEDKISRKIADTPSAINHRNAIHIHGDALLFSTSPSGSFSDAGDFYKIDLSQ